MAKSSRIDHPVEEVIPVLSPEERLVAANDIVRKNVYCAAGVGCVPVPLVDLIGIGGFQALMIKQLSQLYGVKFSDHAARNVVTALLGSLSARVLMTGVAGSIFKIIPGVGAFIAGLIAVPAVAGAVTYAIGRVFIKHFAEGGTLLDLDIDRTKDFFQSQYKVGRKVITVPASA